MILRHYQQSIFDQVIASKSNDLVQLDTGAGKTPIIAALAQYYGQAVVVCHRNILIKQASKTLAACGITHAVMAAAATVRICAVNNRRLFQQSYINQSATLVLVSIDTWHSHFKRGKFSQLPSGVIIIDEAHHLAENKWRLLSDTLNCRCVGFTATPCRSDGYPLIKEFGGFFDRIVQAEGYQENGTERLIAEGFLSEYRAYFCAGSRHQTRFELSLGQSVLTTYQERCRNKQTIAIFPRIDNAENSLNDFKTQGIKAAVIHSGLPQYEIQRALEAFEEKRIRVLIAVDIINEGFDVPEAEALILARDVRSFGLYRQLCGRVLRPAPDKTALIFDLTGESISRHGLPSDPVDWTKRQGQIKRRDITVCHQCGRVYKSILKSCPECGTENNIEARGVGLACFKLRFFDAEMVEQQRKKLAQEEARRLQAQQAAEKQRQWREEYLPINVYFSRTIAGQAAQKLFDELIKSLKKTISAQQYNEFCAKNKDHFGSLPFYLIDGKKGTPMAIYESKK